MKSNRPYFLWDYNLNEDDVRRILAGDNDVERRWLIGRILEAARFADVWKYIKLKDLVAVFPKLKLRSPFKETWTRALEVWNAY